MNKDRIKVRYEGSGNEKKLVFVLSDSERKELGKALREEYCAIEEGSREDIQIKKINNTHLNNSSG